ncbi:MAG: protein phosphatase CheZ [Candidatus Diapherotrites archaeon]|nr:protein phosphatase CheZ [Candidatus Diapherotrites archaeon]
MAWDTSKNHYRLLTGRLEPRHFIKDDIKKLTKTTTHYLEKLKKTKEFKTLLKQTQEYLKVVEKQWASSQKLTTEIVQDLTGLSFRKSFTVYITHPSLRSGMYVQNNQILWGHSEKWPNYSLIYLWHEILHSYFGHSKGEHALIELITDNELRIRLNGGKYPPFEGHDWLNSLRKKLLPSWKKYLKQKKKNIKTIQKKALTFST